MDALNIVLGELRPLLANVLPNETTVPNGEQWDRHWIDGSFSVLRLRDNVWRAWRRIPAPDRLVLTAMNIKLVERPHSTMGGSYAVADLDPVGIVGQSRPVIMFSTLLIDWPDDAVQYAAAHEFAHQYLRHPVWLKRFGRNGAPLMQSFLEQQAIEWTEYVWGFGQEKQAALKHLQGMGAL